MGKKLPLTKNQRKIFDFIKSHIVRQGYAPSIREIGFAFQLSSTATVHHYLKSLETKGFITREPHRARFILLSRRGKHDKT